MQETSQETAVLTNSTQRREVRLKQIRQQLLSLDKVHPATPADNKRKYDCVREIKLLQTSGTV